MPLGAFLKKLDPPPATEIAEAGKRLRFRGLVVVCLIVDKPKLFPDNWIYIHDPTVKVGRIQNYKNWSPDMAPDSDKTSLGLEYFCTPGDELWSRSDAELVELSKQEIEDLDLAKAREVVDGCVLRAPDAYPDYDADYRAGLATVRAFVDGLENFQTIGRNGLHRYNYPAHAMMTGMIAARNLTVGEKSDLWSVNTDQEYHEEALVEDEAVEEALTRVFSRLDRLAFGVGVGAVAGVAL